MSQVEIENWTKRKVNIDKNNANLWVKPREIWWCFLGRNIGAEEHGKTDNFARPVIVLKSFGQHTALVLPLSTSQKQNPFYFSIGLVDGKIATVILSQIRLIDTKRMDVKIATLDAQKFTELKKAIVGLMQ